MQIKDEQYRGRQIIAKKDGDMWRARIGRWLSRRHSTVEGALEEARRWVNALQPPSPR